MLILKELPPPQIRQGRLLGSQSRLHPESIGVGQHRPFIIRPQGTPAHGHDEETDCNKSGHSDDFAQERAEIHHFLHVDVDVRYILMGNHVDVELVGSWRDVANGG